jgi:hypothetical protein
MKSANLGRWSVLLFAAGLLLLLLSFVPQTTSPEESSETVGEQTAAPTTSSTQPVANEGLALFQAKGCPTCHRHSAIVNVDFSTEIGPDLTTYQPDPDFIRDWLRDPSAVRPNTVMPDLNLSGEEIDLLVAFLEE